MKIALILMAALLSSCSTNVLPYSNGTYTVTAGSFLVAQAKKSAYKSGMSYCSKKEKEFSYITGLSEAEGNFTLVFECK